MHTYMHESVGSIAGHSKERQQARPSFSPSPEIMIGIPKTQVQYPLSFLVVQLLLLLFFFVTVFLVLELTYLGCPPKPSTDVSAPH